MRTNFRIGNLSWRFIRVWNRNMVVYRKIWFVNFLVPLLEPVLYIAAFGVGLSSLIGRINYGGESIPYVFYIAPALVAITIMYNSFYENTYASFVRMYYQKTFDAMMTTPLSLEDIIAGEIFWGATKSVIAAAIVLAVISCFGLVSFPLGLMILPLSFLGGLAFGTVGMIFTGFTPSIDMYNLPIFLFITPMFLFGGTFFPISALPGWAQKLAIALPLTHLVNLCRAFSLGKATPDLAWSFIYIAVMFIVLFPVAMIVMRRRLIS